MGKKNTFLKYWFAAILPGLLFLAACNKNGGGGGGDQPIPLTPFTGSAACQSQGCVTTLSQVPVFGASTFTGAVEIATIPNNSSMGYGNPYGGYGYPNQMNMQQSITLYQGPAYLAGTLSVTNGGVGYCSPMPGQYMITTMQPGMLNYGALSQTRLEATSGTGGAMTVVITSAVFSSMDGSPPPYMQGNVRLNIMGGYIERVNGQPCWGPL